MFSPFPHSSANPDVLRYARHKRLALAQELSGQKKVYLDTKYWVLLRDARLGRSEDSNVIELLGRLESAVDAGTLICPFNAEIFFEVLNQRDKQTFDTTIQLIEDLSLGICILPKYERFELEIFHLIESSRKPASSLHTLNELVWTKTCYVLGFLTPNIETLPEDKNIELQKLFCDHLWDIKLSNYLSRVDFDKIPNTSRDISGKLNDGKSAHSAGNTSFKQTFLSEVAGLLDEQSEMFAELIDYLYERERNYSPDKETYDANAGKNLAQLLTEAFRIGKIRGHLPSTTILASLHAAVRWNRERKFKPGDLMDFGHAMAALPYCDLFFTERSLSTLIQDRNLGFQDIYKCKTVYKPSDALALIDSKSHAEKVSALGQNQE